MTVSQKKYLCLCLNYIIITYVTFRQDQFADTLFSRNVGLRVVQVIFQFLPPDYCRLNKPLIHHFILQTQLVSWSQTLWITEAWQITYFMMTAFES